MGKRNHTIHFVSRFLISMFVPMLVCECLAQPIDTIWTRSYGGDSNDGGWVVEALDSGHYVIGADGRLEPPWDETPGLLLIVDNAGDIVHNRTYDEMRDIRDIVVVSDGGFLISGRSTNLRSRIIKTDSIGEPEWEYTFAEAAPLHLYLRAVETENSEFIVVESGGKWRFWRYQSC